LFLFAFDFQQSGGGMIGAITNLDILAHPLVTIRCFGWKVFFKALFAGQRQTFLSLLPQADPAEGVASRLSITVERCIDLELRARRIYAAFARAFADRPAASAFFDTLAKQEQIHADLLAICRVAARRGGWRAECPNHWEEYIPHLEQHLNAVEAALHEVGSLEEALQLVIQIESGEVNRVFQAVLASCDSAFVSRLGTFRRAVEMHISFIIDQLPKLDVRFRSSSSSLQTLFPR
jgi:hypothetical protein